MVNYFFFTCFWVFSNFPGIFFFDPLFFLKSVLFNFYKFMNYLVFLLLIHFSLHLVVRKKYFIWFLYLKIYGDLICAITYCQYRKMSYVTLRKTFILFLLDRAFCMFARFNWFIMSQCQWFHLGVCWSFWMFIFIFKSNLGSFQPVFFEIFPLASLSSSLLLEFPHQAYVGPLDGSHVSLWLCHFPSIFFFLSLRFGNFPCSIFTFAVFFSLLKSAFESL